MHFFDGNKFNSTKLYQVVPQNSSARITSIVIENDDIPLKNLIVLVKEKPQDEVSKIKVYRHKERKGEFEEFKESPINGLEVLSHPFFLDINGDMLTDFVYMSNSSPPKMKVALGASKEGTKFIFKDFSEFTFSSEEDSECKDFDESSMISSPHSNSFLDLNGDCLPDIFLSKVREELHGGTKKWVAYNEIYFGKISDDKLLKFCLMENDIRLLPRSKTEFALKEDVKVPLVQFSDLNLDAMFDLVFYYESKIYVFYNQNLAINFNSDELNDEQMLCIQLNSSDLFSTPVFKNISELSNDQLRLYGTPDITIQDISEFDAFDGYEIIDIANPLHF